ncbi:sigma factor-like helix-turn-helix DNA-binding protein, partial [Rhizobium ruizarguesonis]
LVGASGSSYEEAAAICGCAVGTIKSRVTRARQRLQELLQISGAADFGPDATSAPLPSKAFAFCTELHLEGKPVALRVAGF